jgi:WD40 repeat protein
MSIWALGLSGRLPARCGRTGSEPTGISFRSLVQRSGIRLTCLKTPLITALAAALLILAAVVPPAALAAPGTWSATGSASRFLLGHAAALLLNGKVLMAGGYDTAHDKVESAMLYNPGAGTFYPTGDLNDSRGDASATLLPSGKVLITGGTNLSAIYGAELYDPVSGSFSRISVITPRFKGHTATLLPNGKVLVAGGLGSSNELSSAELYDPATGTFSPTGAMTTGRAYHTATLLPSGKVLVTGGWYFTASAEIYDPATGAFTPTLGPMHVPRAYHTATLLPNGAVLITGGGSNYSNTLDSAEFYHPYLDSFFFTGSMSTPRQNHSANLLPNGKVLVAGGIDGIHYLTSAELYDLQTGSFIPTGPMAGGRSQHTATPMLNNKILVAGGTNGSANLATAELYEPEPAPQVPLPPLLAFFPFEGNAHDASGNGYNATIQGNPSLVTGYEGLAYYFSGGGNYITVPLNINPEVYPRLTLGGWAKTNSSNPLQTLLTHDNGGYDRNIGIDQRGGGIGWSAFCGPTDHVLGAVPAFMDKWTFVAAVYDQTAQTIKFQVDDMVLTKQAVVNQGQNQLYIGGSPQFSNYFSGTIDNIFVFADTLTDQQLAYIRSGGASAILTAPRAKKRGAVAFLYLLLAN